MSTFDHASLIQGINESLSTFRKAQPDAMRGFAQLAQASMAEGRSEERRVGKDCFYSWSPYK